MRNRIKTIDNKIDALTNHSNEIWSEVQQLSDEKSELVQQVIIEEKLLSLPDWEFHNEYTLNCKQYWTDEELKPIVDLLNPDYHSFHRIGPYCTIYFNDGEVHLSFDTLEDMGQLIEEASLRVSLDKVQSEIESLESKLNILIKTRDKFKEL